MFSTQKRHQRAKIDHLRVVDGVDRRMDSIDVMSQSEEGYLLLVEQCGVFIIAFIRTALPIATIAVIPIATHAVPAAVTA